MLKLFVFLIAVSQIWAAVHLPERLIRRITHPRRIIGGAAAPDGSHPYIASIHNKPFNYHSCGAGIISETTLISAGHCVKNSDHKNFQIYVGSLDLSKGGTYHEIASWKAHELFNSNTLKNDISIIKLAQPLQLSEKVQTINLPPKDLDIPDGDTVTAIGWGDIVLDPERIPDHLQYVDLKVVSNSECSERLGDNIGDGQICVGGENGHGLCYGDSGSPLVYEKNGVVYTVGAVSWGQPCAVGYPDVFTRVSAYVDWIEKNA